ncbi:uncharacterized protein LOC130662748 [Hydractinia symbiolongicarpus]|uniref:uncharacterized protein LOC130662748 n=1 Tax=Hydractinia symbiolongicarpus TaxID=13093 RepID=UPI00254DAD47|nr:uncharacterized protein LOC130662748 [Hydractinia symbiolongicarpus]
MAIAGKCVLINLFCTISAMTYLPFSINGPTSYDEKIVIVGAGASGLHMALSLKERGFKNVVILEKTKWLGGKSWTVQHRGVGHEMGAVYLSPDYEDNVIPLVRKYTPGDLVKLPISGIWLDNMSRQIPYDQYVILYAMKYFKTTNVTLAKMGLVKAIIKYMKLHETIFGNYTGDLMPEPTPCVLHQTRGTFLDFLKRHNLEVMSPILYGASSVQGYGRINEIACLYGMMWNTPNFMRSLLSRISGQVTNRTGLYMLRNGFGNLWKTIVREEKLKIIFNVDIFKVYRTKHNNYKDVWIKLRVGRNSPSWERYDFLIWSPEMKTSMKYWSNKEIYDEQFYFSRTKPTYFTTALVDTEGTQRGLSAVDYWFDNIINSTRDSSLWALRDTYAALHGFEGENYTKGLFPSGNDGKPIRSTVTYQMSSREPYFYELQNILRNSLKKIGANRVDILYMKVWRYFPRFSPADMEKGYLWKVLEMQGKYGIWYIGSSVSFESVKSVIEYNKLLLKNMKIPIKK